MTSAVRQRHQVAEILQKRVQDQFFLDAQIALDTSLDHFDRLGFKFEDL